MKNVLTFIAATAVSVALSATAVTALSSASRAEEPVRDKVMRHLTPTFAEVDADHDGMVTETEFVAFVETNRAVANFPSDGGTDRFARADADGDGFVTREEFKAAPRRVVHRRFHMGDPKERFAKADTDRDSTLNEDEFDALFGAMHRLRRHPADPDANDTP